MANKNRVDNFNGKGFHTWQIKVIFFLMKKAIWGVANGKEKKPSTREGELAQFVKYENTLSIIALGLSDFYIHHINMHETSRDAWDHLESVVGTQESCTSIVS